MAKKSERPLAPDEPPEEEHGQPEDLPGKATPAQGSGEPPNPRKDFSAILSKYIDEDTAGIISEHIAATGTDTVFSNADELLLMLAKFPRQVFPTTRKQFLDHWIALNGLVVPEDYEKIADKTAQVVKAMKTGSGQEKFSVDKDTGVITVATRDEPNPLTYEQAEKLSQQTKKVLAERKAQDDQAARQKKLDEEAAVAERKRQEEDAAAKRKKEEEDAAGAGAPPLIQDSQTGQWMPNPNAKRITGGDYAMAWVMNQANRPGETRTPEQIIKDKLTEQQALKELAGGGKETSSLTELVAAAKTMADMMVGKNTGTDPAVVARIEAQDKVLQEMREQNRLLQQKIEDDKERRYMDKIEQIDAARKADNEKFMHALEERDRNATNVTELGVLKSGLDNANAGLTNVLNKVVDLAKMRLGSAPVPMTEGEQKAVVEGVGRVLQKDSELDALATAAGFKR